MVQVLLVAALISLELGLHFLGKEKKLFIQPILYFAEFLHLFVKYLLSHFLQALCMS